MIPERPICKITRNNGSTYYVVTKWFIDRYIQVNDIKYNTFQEAVLAERRRFMNQTAKLTTIFGDPENA